MHTYCINAINQSSFNQSEDSSQSINQFNPKGSKHPINQVRAPWIDWLIDSKSVDYSEYLNRLAWLQRIESSRVEFVLIRVESNFFWSDSIRPNRTTPGFDSIRFDRSSTDQTEDGKIYGNEAGISLLQLSETLRMDVQALKMRAESHL